MHVVDFWRSESEKQQGSYDTRYEALKWAREWVQRFSGTAYTRKKVHGYTIYRAQGGRRAVVHPETTH